MLARLIAFPTVSTASNLDCVEFIRSHLQRYGIASSLVFNAERTKANLFATVGPNVPGGVVLSGHTDVVPATASEWTSSPWALAERDGRLYGRGACDMKGFDALALAAVPDMVAAGLKRPIHIALSYDEEIGCRGVPSLVDAMVASIAAPSAVIVGEPTRMQPVTGHKGSLSFYTRVHGQAAHSSRIDIAVSAVMTAARLVTWLDDTMAENRRRAVPSSFEPPYTTLHCGMISGGTAANIVAASCEFVTDIRAIPSEDAIGFKRRYEAYIRDHIEPGMKRIAPRAGVEIIDRAFVPGLGPEGNGSAESLVREITGASATSVVSYGTEAGFFQRAGWSTVVCGPGDIEQAHKSDEYLELSELAAGAEFMQRLIRHLSA